MSRGPVRNLSGIGMGGHIRALYTVHSTRGEWGFIHGTRSEGAVRVGDIIKLVHTLA